MARSQVDWYGQEVRVRVSNASESFLARIAHQIEAHTKANIVANKQVDTGFMLNSVYVKTPDESGYPAARAAAGARNAQAAMAPEARLEGGAKAAVCVGAEYAIHQERRRSFLYRAAEQVSGEVADVEIQKVACERGLRE